MGAYAYEEAWIRSHRAMVVRIVVEDECFFEMGMSWDIQEHSFLKEHCIEHGPAFFFGMGSLVEVLMKEFRVLFVRLCE